MSGDWIASKLLWLVLAYAFASGAWRAAARRGCRCRLDAGASCSATAGGTLTMCGLAGRFHPMALPPDPEWPRRADALLAHRGPDGRGHYADERCELVHRRLALLDLSADRGAADGERGRHRAGRLQRGDLQSPRSCDASSRAKGHSFRGSSDTEVLVHLYEEHGADMASRLRGMFAFAVLDRPEPGPPGPRSVRDQAALLRGASGPVDLCQRDEGNPGTPGVPPRARPAGVLRLSGAQLHPRACHRVRQHLRVTQGNHSHSWTGEARARTTFADVVPAARSVGLSRPSGPSGPRSYC